MNASVSSAEVPMPDWCKPVTAAHCQTWENGLVALIKRIIPGQVVIHGPAWFWLLDEGLGVGADYDRKSYVPDGEIRFFDNVMGAWVIESPWGDELICRHCHRPCKSEDLAQIPFVWENPICWECGERTK